MNTPQTQPPASLGAAHGSALEDDVERTPERLVEEVRRELEKIDEEFKYRTGIEDWIQRQDAVLQLTLWAVVRLSRMMSSADRKAPNMVLPDTYNIK